MSNNEEASKNKISELENEINSLNTKITKLEQEKNDLIESTNFLEDLANENKEKYSKLYTKSKGKISRLNKEKQLLTDEINNLKNEIITIKGNTKELNNINDKEKK